MRLKARYDRIAVPLLGVVSIVALIAWGLRGLAEWLAWLVGVELAEAWIVLAAGLGISSDLVRLGLFSAIHVVLVVSAIRRLGPLFVRIRAAVQQQGARLERRLGKRRKKHLLKRLQQLRGRLEPVEVGLSSSASLATTVLLVALLIQPTVAPLRINAGTWVVRAANLVDGTATALVVDSVVGAYRFAFAPPVAPGGLVSPGAFDAALDDEVVPLMDRWDPLLLEASGGDRELYAQTKAFMWVESAGRQYALSSTGCAGLMQFCAGTARRKPFKQIFGVGAVSACGCRDCSVPRSTQIALETEADAVQRHQGAFPCDLADARFDGARSVHAGVAYVQELSDQLGGNTALMYIGYNAGPQVAKSLYRTLGRRGDVTLEDLRPHLASALRPHYGRHAEARASGLLEVHLPKLLAAYERWR